jgi:chromosome segregation ATPase
VKAVNLVNLASALVDAGGSIPLGAAEAAGAVAEARQIVDELDDELERDEARQLFALAPCEANEAGHAAAVDLVRQAEANARTAQN